MLLISMEMEDWIFMFVILELCHLKNEPTSYSLIKEIIVMVHPVFEEQAEALWTGQQRL